jgi:TonB family protein
MPVLKRYSHIVPLAWLILAAAGSTTQAQLPDMQLMANHMAEVISASREPSVVVIDFYGPGEHFTKLGAALAQSFDNDLKGTSIQAAVQKRAPMRDWLQDRLLPSNAFKSIDMALWVAGQLKITAVLGGNVLVRENELTVEVNLYDVADRKWLKGFEITSQISPEATDLVASSTVDFHYKFDPQIALAGQNGYTVPKCVSCTEEAPYTEEALKHRTQGSVVVMAVIGTDGSVQKLTVREALPDGLTDRALDEVRRWKFIPATGPDGKPAKVQITMKLAFHIGHQHQYSSHPTRIR